MWAGCRSVFASRSSVRSQCTACCRTQLLLLLHCRSRLGPLVRRLHSPRLGHLRMHRRLRRCASVPAIVAVLSCLMLHDCLWRCWPHRCVCLFVHTPLHVLLLDPGFAATAVLQGHAVATGSQGAQVALGAPPHAWTAAQVCGDACTWRRADMLLCGNAGSLQLFAAIVYVQLWLQRCFSHLLLLHAGSRCGHWLAGLTAHAWGAAECMDSR